MNQTKSTDLPTTDRDINTDAEVAEILEINFKFRCENAELKAQVQGLTELGTYLKLIQDASVSFPSEDEISDGSGTEAEGDCRVHGPASNTGDEDVDGFTTVQRRSKRKTKRSDSDSDHAINPLSSFSFRNKMPRKTANPPVPAATPTQAAKKPPENPARIKDHRNLVVNHLDKDNTYTIPLIPAPGEQTTAHGSQVSLGIHDHGSNKGRTRTPRVPPRRRLQNGTVPQLPNVRTRQFHPSLGRKSKAGSVLQKLSHSTTPRSRDHNHSRTRTLTRTRTTTFIHFSFP